MICITHFCSIFSIICLKLLWHFRILRRESLMYLVYFFEHFHFSWCFLLLSCECECVPSSICLRVKLTCNYTTIRYRSNDDVCDGYKKVQNTLFVSSTKRHRFTNEGGGENESVIIDINLNVLVCCKEINGRWLITIIVMSQRFIIGNFCVVWWFINCGFNFYF